jgi:thioredoxin 2
MSDIQLDDRGFIITCQSCGQKNRVPYSSHETRCGKCKAAMRSPAEPIEVPSVETFDALIRSAGQPVIVDFWAPWCGPCRMVAPEIAKVAESNAGRLIVVKVNTDALPELGERYRIRSIPTMAIFEGGRETARTSGAMPAAQIENFVNGAVKVS